jgi:hypothetical protein
MPQRYASTEIEVYFFSYFIFMLIFCTDKTLPMRKLTFLAILATICMSVSAQRKAYDRLDMFEKEDPLLITLKTDMKDILNKKPNDRYIYSDIKLNNGDSSMEGKVNIRARGKFRKGYCYVPPLKFDFDTTQGSLKGLGKIDMTVQCKVGKDFEQGLFKEYTAYRIYNVLTDKSQHVRLVRLTLEDVEGKRKPVEIPGFYIEDFDVTSKRNACKEVKISKLHTENTDRKQMTLVAMFEYMIGNTDWSVYANHNIKLMQDTANNTSKPYAVAYDFDYSGLVNAEYAVPDEILGTQSVMERVYRGFPREVGELREMANVFLAKKDAMLAEINNSKFLNDRSKKEMLNYLESFFRDLGDDRKLKINFIDNARTN